MSTRKEKAPLSQRLKQSLLEGIDFAQGQKELATSTVPLGRTYSGQDVIAIRSRRNMSQAQFAHLLAVSVKTLQSWEQGARKPSRPTMRLLQIFDSPEDFASVLNKAD